MTALAMQRSAFAEAYLTGARRDPAEIRALMSRLDRANSRATTSALHRCRDADGLTPDAWLEHGLDRDRHHAIHYLGAAERSDPAAGRVCAIVGRAMGPAAPGVETLLALAGAARLRSGGRWALLVDGPAAAAEAFAPVAVRVDAAVERELPGLRAHLGGRPADPTGDFVRRLGAARPGAEVRTETRTFRLQEPPMTLAEDAAALFPMAFLLSPAARVQLLATLAAHFAYICRRGRACFPLPVTRVIVDFP